MYEQQVLEVRQGIWIDQHWIRAAGLGNRLQVIVEPGEIRITTAPTDGEQQEAMEKGWNVFRSLGRDAQPGRLPDASVQHDRYLYGKGE